MRISRVAQPVAGALILLTACTPGEVDVAGLEQEIVSDIRQQTGQTVTVHCPASVSWRTGGTFACRVTRASGQKVKADVTMNDAGRLAWELES